jgi:pilus assembly protein FimV
MTAGGDTQAGGFAATTSGEGARWQEMATKLDLAAAYEEIGDKEGARELLQEVLQGGDAGQQEQARAMIAKLA